MNYTTIQITPLTRERLAKIRTYRRETYDELLNALIDIVPAGDDEGQYSDEFRASLIRGMRDIKAGNTHTAEDVRKQLGLSK